MSIQITETTYVRTTIDTMNPRIHITEYKCAVCGEWIDEEDTVWLDADGEASTADDAKAYHLDCAPEQSSHASDCPLRDKAEWSGSPNPDDPDNEWICDGCGAVITARGMT